MFKPNCIYYEKNIENYVLGKKLLEKYKEVPKILIDNHNNIEEMRKKQNSEFPYMKRNLIIGIRKTHKFVENHKVSDYLVPYTSSGCTAMCLYCYLVCNYNKCAYLRIFVNREQMLDKIIKVSNKSEKELTFEIGTSRLKDRVVAINKLKSSGYKVGILVAPVIFVDNWKEEYEKLVKYLCENLSEDVKKDVFFEVIFMTYSYVHRMINQEVFPNAINLYNQELMTGRGKGKYMYKSNLKQEGENFFRDILSKYFPNNKIIYIV